MATDLKQHPLLATEHEARELVLPESLLEELRDLAMEQDQLSTRSRRLFEQLRKMLGQERLADCLAGIQWLACHDEAAGARLLAALFDAQTPGSQLLPRIRPFYSVHRMLHLDPELVGDAFLGDWQSRLEQHVLTCQDRLGLDDVDPDRIPAPLDEPPLPLLRRMLDMLQPTRSDQDLAADDMLLLAGLVRLECDAYQERVSRLASTIDPYQVTAVMRALPLLNRADAEIRDLDQLAVWLESGDLSAVFRTRIPREHEVLDEKERPRLASALAKDPRLATLAGMHAAFVSDPLAMRQIAGPSARVMMLAQTLHREGLRDDDLSLLGAVRIVLEHRGSDGVVLELPAELAETVGQILMTDARGDDAVRGFELRDRKLHVVEPRLGMGDRIWRHDLPTLAEIPSALAEEAARDAAARREDEAPVDMSASAVKRMVMNQVGSVSILLGFLRNPKVTSIPGLVADVTRRTRSTRVLEVIANDRTLHSGFANKDVPRAMLESPCNLSVKTLRRFIHVKFVSKTDLRRLAKDKARIRKEVVREIEAYLDSLT
jgi:hypothetical protein